MISPPWNGHSGGIPNLCVGRFQPHPFAIICRQPEGDLRGTVYWRIATKSRSKAPHKVTHWYCAIIGVCWLISGPGVGMTGVVLAADDRERAMTAQSDARAVEKAGACEHEQHYRRCVPADCARPALSEHAMCHGCHRSIRTRAQTQLGQCILNLDLHRARGDAEIEGDHFVAGSMCIAA
jgi:hypothetical protein